MRSTVLLLLLGLAITAAGPVLHPGYQENLQEIISGARPEDNDVIPASETSSLTPHTDNVEQVPEKPEVVVPEDAEPEVVPDDVEQEEQPNPKPEESVVPIVPKEPEVQVKPEEVLVKPEQIELAEPEIELPVKHKLELPIETGPSEAGESKIELLEPELGLPVESEQTVPLQPEEEVIVVAQENLVPLPLEPVPDYPLTQDESVDTVEIPSQFETDEYTHVEEIPFSIQPEGSFVPFMEEPLSFDPEEPHLIKLESLPFDSVVPNEPDTFPSEAEALPFDPEEEQPNPDEAEEEPFPVEAEEPFPFESEPLLFDPDEESGEPLIVELEPMVFRPEEELEEPLPSELEPQLFDSDDELNPIELPARPFAFEQQEPTFEFQEGPFPFEPEEPQIVMQADIDSPTLDDEELLELIIEDNQEQDDVYPPAVMIDSDTDDDSEVPQEESAIYFPQDQYSPFVSSSVPEIDEPETQDSDEEVSFAMPFDAKQDFQFQRIPQAQPISITGPILSSFLNSDIRNHQLISIRPEFNPEGAPLDGEMSIAPLDTKDTIIPEENDDILPPDDSNLFYYIPYDETEDMSFKADPFVDEEMDPQENIEIFRSEDEYPIDATLPQGVLGNEELSNEDSELPLIAKDIIPVEDVLIVEEAPVEEEEEEEETTPDEMMTSFNPFIDDGYGSQDEFFSDNMEDESPFVVTPIIDTVNEEEEEEELTPVNPYFNPIPLHDTEDGFFDTIETEFAEYPFGSGEIFPLRTDEDDDSQTENDQIVIIEVEESSPDEGSFIPNLMISEDDQQTQDPDLTYTPEQNHPILFPIAQEQRNGGERFPPIADYSRGNEPFGSFPMKEEDNLGKNDPSNEFIIFADEINDREDSNNWSKNDILPIVPGVPWKKLPSQPLMKNEPQIQQDVSMGSENSPLSLNSQDGMPFHIHEPTYYSRVPEEMKRPMIEPSSFDRTQMNVGHLHTTNIIDQNFDTPYDLYDRFDSNSFEYPRYESTQDMQYHNIPKAVMRPFPEDKFMQEMPYGDLQSREGIYGIPNDAIENPFPQDPYTRSSEGFPSDSEVYRTDMLSQGVNVMTQNMQSPSQVSQYIRPQYPQQRPNWGQSYYQHKQLEPFPTVPFADAIRNPFVSTGPLYFDSYNQRFDFGNSYNSLYNQPSNQEFGRYYQVPRYPYVPLRYRYTPNFAYQMAYNQNLPFQQRPVFW